MELFKLHKLSSHSAFQSKLHTTGVGQLTDLPERVSHILNEALFVIKWMKQSITCSFLVPSPGKSGSGCYKVWACRS
jgi:hypothetical protein